ncbi:MAG: paraquat-inducible protein A [Deltaproteobacteria bacterium]|nr:MAG: paraquat-inducible protein A [Deltaproteobacteria bacterium]
MQRQMKEQLIACRACDLLHRVHTVPNGGAAYCSRCGTPLYKPKHDSINRTLAFAVAGAIFFIIANTLPFLSFKIGAQIQETTLITGIAQLYQQGMYLIAALVLFTVVLVPAIHLIAMLYILTPRLDERTPRFLAPVFRLYNILKPWGMLEIFLLGILVSLIKLVKMATIVPGTALYAFFALIFTLAAMAVTLDAHEIWEKVNH